MIRRVIFTEEARSSLQAQVDYLLSHHAHSAAESLRDRAFLFLSRTLARFPASGRQIPERDLWEIWIPRTRLVIWYRFSAEELTIVTFWHASQDRKNLAGG